MGVLIEALSVIVPVGALNNRYPGGVERYEHDAPNATYCADGHLTRVGFMAPPDVKAFVESLQSRGLHFRKDRSFADIAVVDQLAGPTLPCDWLIAARHPSGFSVAWLKGTAPNPMAVPNSWELGKFNQLEFIPNDEAQDRILPLVRDGMMDIVLDYATGKQLYVGRTTRNRNLILPDE